MKYFIIEGTLINPKLITDEVMNEHKAYTQKAMDKGMIFLSGLKKSMDGAVFIMKAEEKQAIEDYLSKEPFKRYGIQDYKVIEFDIHYINNSPNDWFK